MNSSKARQSRSRCVFLQYEYTIGYRPTQTVDSHIHRLMEPNLQLPPTSKARGHVRVTSEDRRLGSSHEHHILAFVADSDSRRAPKIFERPTRRSSFGRVS